MTAPPRGPRRTLAQAGGPIEIGGDREAGVVLRRALEASADPDSARDHVHGFHSYPARLHPRFARVIIEALAPAGGVVLDPFCGSGTVLVEARIAGREGLGVDANPLAVMLSDLKAAGRSPEQLAELLQQVERVAEVATDRRKKRAGASRRYLPEDVDAFAPHVLLELDGLSVGIGQVSSAPVRRDLELVLSSLLTKVSRKGGDSAEGEVDKRIAAGFPTRLFIGKARELRERMAAYQGLLPPNAPRPAAFEGDARELGPVRDRAADLVVCSPPYPGNYDYLQHHALRLRWLGLRSSRFDEREMGARRKLERRPGDPARAAWLADLVASLSQIRRVLVPGGAAVLVLGDSVVADEPFYNDDLVHDAALAAGLTPVARASQPRAHFHFGSRDAFRDRPRREHALFLSADGRGP